MFVVPLKSESEIYAPVSVHINPSFRPNSSPWQLPLNVPGELGAVSFFAQSSFHTSPGIPIVSAFTNPLRLSPFPKKSRRPSPNEQLTVCPAGSSRLQDPVSRRAASAKMELGGSV